MNSANWGRNNYWTKIGKELYMKTILKTSLLGLALTVSFMGYSRSSSADDSQTPSQATATESGQRHHHGFRMGVCVGQTLAKAGVTLPAAPTPGDQATHAAFKSAIESCRAQFKNQAPTQSSGS
jgi:hypothetical protein